MLPCHFAHLLFFYLPVLRLLILVRNPVVTVVCGPLLLARIIIHEDRTNFGVRIPSVWQA